MPKTPKQIWAEYEKARDKAIKSADLLSNSDSLSLKEYNKAITTIYENWGEALEILSQYQKHPKTFEFIEQQERADIRTLYLFPKCFEKNLALCKKFFEKASRLRHKGKTAEKTTGKIKQETEALRLYTICIQLTSLFLEDKMAPKRAIDFKLLANAFYERALLYRSKWRLNKSGKALLRAIKNFKQAKKYYLKIKAKSEIDKAKKKIKPLECSRKELKPQTSRDYHPKTWRQLDLERKKTGKKHQLEETTDIGHAAKKRKLIEKEPAVSLTGPVSPLASPGSRSTELSYDYLPGIDTWPSPSSRRTSSVNSGWYSPLYDTGDAFRSILGSSSSITFFRSPPRFIQGGCTPSFQIATSPRGKG